MYQSRKKYGRYTGSYRRPAIARQPTQRRYKRMQLQVPRKALLAARPSSVEIKTFDYVAASMPTAMVAFPASIVGIDYDLATGMTCLNTIGAGTGFWNRIGSKITMIACDLAVTVHTIAAKPSACRLMVVYDRQPNGAYPLMNEVVFPNNVGNAEFLSSVRNPNQKRFAILRDRVFTVDGSQLSYNYKEHITFRLPVMYRGIESDVNASIGDLTEGSLLFIVGATTADATGPIVDNISSRIKYLD